MSIQPEKNYPSQYEGRLTLKNDRKVFVRPVLPTDGQLILDLFTKLSARSVYQRFLRQLRFLPPDMLHRFTHINYNKDFALAGVIEEDKKEAIIAVARYIYTPNENTTDLGIAVRDDWQNFGLGKTLLKKIIDVAKDRGIVSFESMIDPQNNIIMRILLDLGYKVSYSLRSGFFHVVINV